MRPTILRALFLSFVALSALAGTPYQVVDLKGVSDATASSQPRFQTSVNGVALFVASPAGTSTALWRTDGTPDGTFALKTFALDQFGGIVSNGTTAWFSVLDSTGWGVWRTDGRTVVAVETNFIDPMLMFATLGGKAFAVYGARELWVIDDTHAESLGLITPVINYRFSAARDGNILYVGTDGGVWRTDGTRANTTKISTNGAYALTIANGRLFYGGQTFDNGIELWVSDGNSAGRMVADLAPGQPSTFGPLSTMGAIGDRVLFIAANGDVIASDGTESGTSILRHGSAPDANSVIVPFHDALYFTSSNQLWRSDGTVAGTQVAVDAKPTNFLLTPSQMFFAGTDPQHGRSLFSSDGTAAGTHWIATASNDQFTIASGKLFFAGDDPYHGGEPWISDGTPAGSHLIANLADDKPGSSRPRNFVAGADRLYFVADGDSGTDVWSTDGTASGTKSVIHATTAGELPFIVGAAGNMLYIRRTHQLVKVDGASGETLVHNFGSDSGPTAGFTFGGRLYFLASVAGSSQLFTTDGTDAGTLQLTNDNLGGVLPPVWSGGQLYVIGRRSGVVYAVGTTPQTTRSVARTTDGTGSDSNLLPLAGSLLSFGQAGNETHLWKFSGGTNDATLVKTLKSGFVQGSASIGNTLLYVWREGAGPFQLWKTDGTADGTQQIVQFSNGNAGYITPLTPLGNRVLFAMYDGTALRPWVTDGTAAGTKILAAVTPANTGTNPFQFFVADGLAYFAADGSLWQSDGTPEGTKAVAGAAAVTEAVMARVADTLYFTAATKELGTELWAYPLPGPGALAIDDIRVDEHAGHASVGVRLTQATNQRVSVDYETADLSAQAGRDYTAASGTLTFEAGEVAKTISIAINDDTTPGPSRAFLVRLHDANVAIEKTSAGVAIDDDDNVADVELIFHPTFSPSFELVNHGPARASNVVLCTDSFGEITPDHRCYSPLELAVGESHSYFNLPSGTTIAGTETQWERDPVPANNSSTWVRRSNQTSLYVSPSTLHAGERGTVALGLSSGADITFTSSDPTVLRVPDDVTKNSDRTLWWATFTALKPGTVTITAQMPFPQTVTVQVLPPAEVVRQPAAVQIETFQALTFGLPNEIVATIAGVSATGAAPSGTIEFFIDAVSIGSGPIAKGRASVVVRNPPPGLHAYQAKYAGDALFLPAASQSVNLRASKGTPSFSATSTGGANVVIALRGLDGYPPAGTITVFEDGSTARTAGPLAKSGAGSATSTATGFSAAASTVRIEYSGDGWYDAASITIPITGTHRRSAGR